MSDFYKKLAKLFYPILILSVIIFVIPGKYKIAVYGLNYLGWVTVFLVFLSFIVFIILLFLDIKNKNNKTLVRRLWIFILAIVLYKIVGHYNAKKNAEMTKDDLIEMFKD
jgi:hypothetical protein